MVVSSFIDGGAGLASPIWLVLALVLNSENNFIISKLRIWVWCGVAIMNGRIIYVFTLYKRLLANRLHSEAVELCLANS